MRRQLLVLAALVSVAYAAPLRAQSLGADLAKDAGDVEQKLLGLANALSEAQYKWRPGEGVRSVQEVLLHVAADNYFIPIFLGVPGPASTRIVTANDFPATQEFEKQVLSKAATAEALTASFTHFRNALTGIPDARMSEEITVFGHKMTVRQFMIVASTHLHEHLGQLIAYARTNHVKPPWSQ